MSKIDEKLFGTGFFGHTKNVIKQGIMNERFTVPPFSVLDTTSANWRNRKQKWLDLGLKGELGRRVDTTSDKTGIAYRHTLNGFGKGLRKAYKLKEMGVDISDFNYHGEERTGSSVFDPVLCELVYKWFSKPGWKIGDPFAGGSTRGAVAGLLGRKYTGVEVRAEQVAANESQADELGLPNSVVWLEGDSSNFSSVVGTEKFDAIFSCPPFYCLELYSVDNDLDGSTKQTYEEFLVWYKGIYAQVVQHLNENRFFVIVVSEVRNKKTGEYYNFVGDTISMCKELGMHYWAEMILVNSRGSLSLRTNRPFSQTRKIGRAHQNVLVFFKGDVSKIRENFETDLDGFE